MFPANEIGDRLRAKREDMGMSLYEMAEKCRCGVTLLQGLEELGWVTVPGVARRIARGYGLTQAERRVITGPDIKRKLAEYASRDALF